MKHLGSATLCLALWLGAWAGVRAEPAPNDETDGQTHDQTDGETDGETDGQSGAAISVAIQGPVPFGRAELHDALLPRLEDAAIDARVAARGAVVEVGATAGGVLVRVGARERALPLGERTGPGAARVVALVVLDLLLSEGPALPMPLALPPAAEADELMPAPAAATDPHTAAAPATDPHTAAAPATHPPPVIAAPAHIAPPRLAPPGVITRPAPETAARPAPRPVPGPRAAPTRTITHVRLSGFGGTVLGAAGEQATMVSAGADVRLGLGRWRAGAGLSWLHLPMISYEQTDVGLDGALLRLDAGRALGDVELTAAAFAMPSRLHTDGSETPRDHHHSLLFGGGAAIRAGARLGRRWRLVATAGVDVFGRRLRVRTPDEVITSTPLVTISLAVGVGWEVMP